MMCPFKRVFRAVARNALNRHQGHDRRECPRRASGGCQAASPASCGTSGAASGKRAFRGSSAVEQWTVEAATTGFCAWKTCRERVGAGRRFCGLKCTGKFFVDHRRKRLKQMAIAYRGGKCERCGYAKCETALAFHRLDPASKDFSISADGITRSWEKVRKELDKCALVCANCHAEIHARQHVPGQGSEKPGEFGGRRSDQRRAKSLRRALRKGGKV